MCHLAIGMSSTHHDTLTKLSTPNLVANSWSYTCLSLPFYIFYKDLASNWQLAEAYFLIGIWAYVLGNLYNILQIEEEFFLNNFA